MKQECNYQMTGELNYEIDRLKAELEDTIKYCKPYGGNPRVCTRIQAHKDLERQMAEARAEARAEVEALTDLLNGSRKATYTAEMYDKGVAQARQEAAREILHIISMETMDRPFEQSQAVEIIRQHYILEG